MKENNLNMKSTNDLLKKEPSGKLIMVEKRRNILIILLLIIIIVGLIVYAYILSKKIVDLENSLETYEENIDEIESMDEEASTNEEVLIDEEISIDDWATYSDESIGISFKYPSNDTLTPPDFAASIGIQYSNNLMENSELTDGYSIDITYNPNNLISSLSDRAVELSEPISDSCIVSKISIFEVDNSSVYYFSESNCFEGTDITDYYLMQGDNNYYEITASDFGENSSYYRSITRAIIESIKFL